MAQEQQEYSNTHDEDASDYQDRVPVSVLRKIVSRLGEYTFYVCFQNARESSVVEVFSTSSKVVLKFIEDEYQVKREVKINNLLQGKHVVQLISTLACPSPLFSKILLFDAYDGTLAQLPELNGQQLRSLMFQLLVGVKECHAVEYIHSDIREENIFFKIAQTSEKQNSVAKAINSVGMEFALGDFGCSVKEENPPDMVGSVLPNNRQAPETLLKRNFVKRRSFDIWTVGVVFVQYLLNKKPLFVGETSMEVREEIIQTDLDQKLAISDLLAKDLAKKLLNTHRKSRITAEDAIKHPYFAPFL